jgi:hypothetical protein
VPCREELGQDARQKLDLTRRPDELLVNHTTRVDPVLNRALEQEWGYAAIDQRILIVIPCVCIDKHLVLSKHKGAFRNY